MSVPMMDAVSIADAVRSGKISAEQITKDFVGRAQTANGSLNAFHELFESEALEAARAVDVKVSDVAVALCLRNARQNTAWKKATHYHLQQCQNHRPQYQ